MDGNPP